MPLHIGSLQIDVRNAWLHGRDLELRPLDLRVLTQLARDAGRTIPREQLAERLWGPETTVDPRAVDTCVTRIRRAMNGCGHAIVTVRRVGYRLDPERLS